MMVCANTEITRGPGKLGDFRRKPVARLQRRKPFVRTRRMRALRLDPGLS
jgi:hypothetical protein